MRFAAVVVFAGAALASQKGGEGEGDQYTTVTDVKTISSCAPEVTDCTWAHKTSSSAATTTSAPETWKTPGTKPPVSSDSWPTKSKPSSWAAPESSTTSSGWSKPTGGNWGNNSTTLTTSKSSPTGTWPSGTWDDCECDDDDTCEGGNGSASPTGSWSTGTGSSSPVGGGSGSSSPVGGGSGNGNGSVTTSSPTGVVTAGAGVAGPAFLAVVAGLVAFLA